MLISEVSERYGISSDTLRYYEKIGLLPPIKRINGIRDYSIDDGNWIHFIKCMRSAGLSIESLQKYVELFRQGDDKIAERKALLLAERKNLEAKLKDMESALQRLDHKIMWYDEKIQKYEKQRK
ncbi:HTH-type transcriptional regulator AdhR [bioreactor metagenome]|uniref:HTH-type transcriptional regulator AdhR n=1 Tax=bioreactor metagenome TaxID=1076179 RepID=A0A645BJC4_9ZZZZ